MLEKAGQIVAASIEDTIDNDRFRYLAVVRSGPLADQTCYVAYDGPGLGTHDVLVRIDRAFDGWSERNLDQRITKAYYVSSEVPLGFEAMSSESVLLYGVWQERMNPGILVPRNHEIRPFFCPGRVESSLFYASRGGDILPYGLYFDRRPDIMRRGKTADSKPRNPGNALRRYVSRIRSERFARMAIVDESVSIAELNKLLSDDLKKMRLHPIRMQPQK